MYLKSFEYTLSFHSWRTELWVTLCHQEIKQAYSWYSKSYILFSKLIYFWYTVDYIYITGSATFHLAYA